jgi:tRNA splicing endonuclease
MQKESKPHRARCGEIIFSILEEKSPSYIINRYKVGKFSDSILNLDPYEAFFLMSKDKIEPENPLFRDPLNFIKRVQYPEIFLLIFPAYESFKQMGLQVKVEGKYLMFRRNSNEEYSCPYMVIREDDSISWKELLEMGNINFLVLDDELDITAFSMQELSPEGNHQPAYSGTRNGGTAIAEISSGGDFLPWMGEKIGKWTYLNRFERNFLSGPDSESLSLEQRVYNDLAGRGFIIRTGFKYGANFRIYAGKLEEHADFLVHVFPEEEQWYKISRAVRVAHAVRKKMIFAGESQGKIAYRKIERVRDPVSASLS